MYTLKNACIVVKLLFAVVAFYINVCNNKCIIGFAIRGHATLGPISAQDRLENSTSTFREHEGTASHRLIKARFRLAQFGNLCIRYRTQILDIRSAMCDLSVHLRWKACLAVPDFD
jgi:hypothetical protein